MKTAEESYDCLHPLVDDSAIIDPFESFSELIVAVEGEVRGGEGLSVHESHESLISAFLEVLVVVEALNNDLVYLLL